MSILRKRKPLAKEEADPIVTITVNGHLMSVPLSKAGLATDPAEPLPKLSKARKDDLMKTLDELLDEPETDD